MGPQGPIGLTGPQGPKGTPGTNGSFNFTGPFNSATNYNVYDVVTYNGSTYDATTAIPSGGGAPDLNPSWAVLAQQGAAGLQGPIGVTGATGPQGPIGPQGPQGPQGIPGTSNGSGGAGFNFTGTFNSATDYNAYDVVTYNGSTYDATVAIAHGGGTPDVNPNWALMAQQGASGAAGQQGPQGVPGPMGATGSQGPVGLTGPQGPIGLDGPPGPIGFTGAQGPPGTNGANGTGFHFTGTFNSATDYNAYDVVSYNGSTYDATVAIPSGGGAPDVNPSWALMAQQGASGAAGQQGLQGIPGPMGATGSQGPIGLTGPQGPPGLTGPQGPIGLTGATGPQGLQGAPGTNGTGFHFTGTFNSATDYNAYDVVTYNGSTYDATVAIAQGGGTPDVNPNWALVAQQGATGQQGLNGATGPTGPQGLTGATGSQGPAGATGPQGPIGLTGATGPQGPAGPSIPGVASDGANGLTVQGNYTGGSGPTSINGLYQPTNTCPVATGMDWAICVGADHKLHCTNKDGSACQ